MSKHAAHARHGHHDPRAWGAREPDSTPRRDDKAPPRPAVPATSRAGPADREESSLKKRHHKIFFWVFLAVQLLFLAWIIGGAVSSGGTPAECSGLTGDDLQLCKDASDVGTTIGVGLIIGLWVAVDFILALTYFIYRLARRAR